MTNTDDLWARVVHTRTQGADVRFIARVGGPHERAPRRDRLRRRAASGRTSCSLWTDSGARRGLFRSHEQAELVGAIADTRTMFEGKGWRDEV
jgi:hypothetical protein